MRCHADFGGYMWHSASCKICKKYIFWGLSVKQNCAATRSSWCSYDTEVSCRLGRGTSASHLALRPTVRAVTATTADLRRSFPCRHREMRHFKWRKSTDRSKLPVRDEKAPLSSDVQCFVRRQQLIFGALFHVVIGKRYFKWKKKIDRSKLPGKDKQANLSCDVLCFGGRRQQLISSALFWCLHQEGLFWVKKLIVKSIWSAEDTSHNRQVKCWLALGRNINHICMTCLKKRFQWTQSEKYKTKTTESRFVKFKLKCSWSKGRRGHTYISKQLSWVVICPLKKN